MRLSAHELHDLNELTLGCATAVTCTSTYINQAQDPDLKAMLMRHQQHHVQGYNQLVGCLQQQGQVTGSMAPAPEIEVTLSGFNMTTVDPAPPMAPRTTAQTLNDREIAAAYLLDMKRSGREYAWAAMEMAHPELRLMLEESFRTCSHHAHEVWQYMASRGYYPVQPAPDRTVQTVGGMYLPITDEAGAGETAAPAMGNSIIPPVDVPQIVQNTPAGV